MGLALTAAAAALWIGVAGFGGAVARYQVEGHVSRLTNSDTWHGKPLYQAIVEALREQGLAGATVLRGIEGFGASSRLHTARIVRLSEDLPLVIEVVDDQDKIARVLPLLDEMVTEGLVTLERVEVIAYRARHEP